MNLASAAKQQKNWKQLLRYSTILVVVVLGQFHVRDRLKNSKSVMFNCTVVSLGWNRQPVLNTLTCPRSLVKSFDLYKINTKNIVVLSDAERWLSIPIASFVQTLHTFPEISDTLVVQFQSFGCPTKYSQKLDVSSQAKLQGTLGFPVGSLDWWYIILHSVGFTQAKLDTVDASCTLKMRLVSSTNCGCLCDAVNKDIFSSPKYSPFSVKHFDFEPQSRKSCAVVTNAGIIGATYSPHLGSLIDAHSYVIRMNHAPASDEYAIYAGMRTDLRVSFPFKQLFGAVKHSETLALSVYHDFEKIMLEKALNQSLVQAQTLHIISEKFRDAVKKCAKQEKGHTSTGLNTLALALYLCQRVIIFGKSYSLSTLDARFPGHYFEDIDNALQKSQVHEFHKEEEIFRQLFNDSFINLVP